MPVMIERLYCRSKHFIQHITTSTTLCLRFHRRRGNAIVLYDAASQQLSVRDAASHDQLLELTDCPYCHRPLRQDFQPDREPRPREQFRRNNSYGNRGDDHRPFVDPDYFGMLAASQRASPSSTAPGTPTARRLVQPAIRSGRSRDVSGAAGPPSGAEFVASEPTPATGQRISSSAFSQGSVSYTHLTLPTKRIV